MAARLALLVTLVVTCSVAALPTDRDDRIIMRATKAFAALEMSPITDLASARKAIDRSEVIDPDHLLSDGPRTKLLDAIAEFLWLQSTATAEQYAQWRADHGWEFEPRDTWIDAADYAYPIATGRPLTDDVTVEQAFAALWNHGRSADEGRWRISAVASEHNAASIGVKRSDADDSFWPPPYRVPLAPEYYGNISGFARHWWRCDRSLEARVTKGESLLDAGIVVIVEMENGTRLPLAMRFIFDEPLNEWRIEGAYLIWHQSPSNKWQTRFMGMVIDW